VSDAALFNLFEFTSKYLQADKYAVWVDPLKSHLRFDVSPWKPFQMNP